MWTGIHSHAHTPTSSYSGRFLEDRCIFLNTNFYLSNYKLTQRNARIPASPSFSFVSLRTLFLVVLSLILSRQKKWKKKTVRKLSDNSETNLNHVKKNIDIEKIWSLFLTKVMLNAWREDMPSISRVQVHPNGVTLCSQYTE